MFDVTVGNERSLYTNENIYHRRKTSSWQGATLHSKYVIIKKVKINRKCFKKKKIFLMFVDAVNCIMILSCFCVKD